MNQGPGQDRIREILELARWAPSGDNTQPWRFEIVDDALLRVHGFDTSAHCVYDLDRTSSHLAIGALLENITIAATRFGLRALDTRQGGASVEHLLIDIRFEPCADLPVDPLLTAMKTRSVQRRCLDSRPLTPAEKAALVEAVGPKHTVVWRETLFERVRLAHFLFRSAKLRLVMPEAYEVHRSVIEWGTTFSDDRVPESAVGLDPLTARLMRWVMRSWGRVTFFNRFLGGTWVPRIQLDVMPALRCAAHFVIVRVDAPTTVDDFIDGGRAMQRVWLEATRLGLQFQPQMTPLIFARYGRARRTFSRVDRLNRAADRIAQDFARLFGAGDAARAVFFGRMGHGPNPSSRSLRLPLEMLMYRADQWPPDQKLRRAST